MKEQILDRRTVYAGKLVDFEVARVRLATGDEAERTVVRHPGAVAIVALTRSTDILPQGWQILLVRQFRFPVEVDILEIPAGVIDPGEQPLQAAQRELSEEMDRAAGAWHELGTFYTSPGYTDEQLTLFLALDLKEAEGEPDPGEDLDIVMMPLTLAIEKVYGGEMQDAKTATALLLAANWLSVHGFDA